MIKKINIIKYGKKCLKMLMMEKVRLIDSNFPIEKIFKIHSITIVIKSLIEKDKFYLELALNCCLFEPYETKL